MSMSARKQRHRREKRRIERKRYRAAEKAALRGDRPSSTPQPSRWTSKFAPLPSTD